MMKNKKNIRKLLMSMAICLLVACAGVSHKSDNVASDLNKGLVAHWTMDRAQIDGNTVKDSSGKHDGILVGGVSQIGGKIGEALELDGKSGYITFGNILNEVFSDVPKAKGATNLKKEGNRQGNKFSISMWVKPSKLNKNVTLLGKLGNSACQPPKNERQFSLGIGDQYKANNVVGFYTDTLYHKGYAILHTPKPAPINEWTHIAVTYDEGVVTSHEKRMGLYLNGEKQPLYVVVAGGDSAYKIEPGPAPLVIGNAVSTGGPCTTYDFFAGGVDDVRIYARLLSNTEIRKLFGGAGRLSRSYISYP